MARPSAPAPVSSPVTHDLPGLEVDNLLAFLALLGLLRALEAEKPEWQPRASWSGPPWLARLHLAHGATQEQVAQAAAAGVIRIASEFDVGDRSNVNFDRLAFREYATRHRRKAVTGSLAAALTAEFPEKRGGGLYAAPLVFMFGQGHQNFLQRLVDVPMGRLLGRHEGAKRAPDFRDPAYIARALFQPWRREDDADGFRWDPEEDQRYALRFGNPSKAGAALTVHGANRLAALGLLSYPCAPGMKQANVPGTHRADGGLLFLWPIWTEPLTLHAVECLLRHPELPKGGSELRPLGVADVYAARRVSNGKFMNVARAVPCRT